jgi:hypothetical protein
VRKKYQRESLKSNHKFEIVGEQELRVPLPMAEVWAELQAQVEELTGQAGLQILRAIVEEEVSRRVGPPHRANPSWGCVRWGRQPGYVVFSGRKVPLQRPRVRTREGQEVELESYGQLQQDGKLQRAVQEGMVAGLSTRNYRRAVTSVLEGYGTEKSSVSRQFVAASSNQLRLLCERRLEDLNLVVLMIDGIHFGGQVLVAALGIAEGGEKHVLGVWQGATENTTVVKGLLEDLVERGLDLRRRYLVVIDGSPHAPLRERYAQTLELVRALGRARYRPALITVKQLGNLWRSLPQLNDATGLNQMVTECDLLVDQWRAN